MFAQIILFLSIIASVNARCDNACSGHGTCNIYSLCECYDNFGMNEQLDNGDCSDRVCPYDVSFADKPDILGVRHRYAECSDAGSCNRATGECQCYKGYEGPACQRMSCPNSCSGHGVCILMEDLPYGNVFADYGGSSLIAPNNVYDYQFQDPKTFPYDGWDAGKIGGCLCDPEYGDIDCSKRLCPRGADVMDIRNQMDRSQRYQVQQFDLNMDPNQYLANPGQHPNMDGMSFAITFTSQTGERFTTKPLTINTASENEFHEFVETIETALKELPNQVIDDCDVKGYYYKVDRRSITINVTFTGASVQGNQNLLTIQAYECLDGCSPKITGLPLQPGNETVKQIVSADYGSYECGRRGKCDYTSGLCNCFSGYTGVSCGTITALV